MYQYEITNPKFGASWCCVRSAFPVYTPDIGKNQRGDPPRLMVPGRRKICGNGEAQSNDLYCSPLLGSVFSNRA